MRLKYRALEAATEVVRLVRENGSDRNMPAKQFAALIVQRYLRVDREHSAAKDAAVSHDA